MSGIVGICNLDGRPVENGVLARMSATLAHRGPDGDRLWVAGPMGLACQHFKLTPESLEEIQPLVHARGAALVFDGRLDNRAELLPFLKDSPGIAVDSPDAVFVLEAYYAFGDRCVERLNGDFALGLFDPEKQRLLLARDVTGVRPLYYCRAGSAFVFASEIKAILAHPEVCTRPNDDMLARFLCAEPIENGPEATYFAGIFSLLPAHVMTVSSRGVDSRRYWDFDLCPRPRLGSFQEYAEAFRHYFAQAVRRRLRSAYPIGVSVSGGLDSSSIFCLAETLRRQEPERHPSLHGFSYSSTRGSPSDETVFVNAIESRYGVAIERVPIEPGFMNDCQESIAHMEDPCVELLWNAFHQLHGTIRRRGVRLLLTGHWSDEMLLEQVYLTDLFGQGKWGTLWEHLKELPRWGSYLGQPRACLWRRFFLDLGRRYAPNALFPLLGGIRAKFSARRLEVPWYTDKLRQRSRNGVSQPTFRPRRLDTTRTGLLRHRASSFNLLKEWLNKAAAMHGLEIAFPFLDRDLIMFAMGVPGEIASWQGVPKALVRQAMRGVLPEAIARRGDKANFDHLDQESLQRDCLPALEWLKAAEMAVRWGYVRRDWAGETFHSWKDRNPRAAANFLWGLLGLELWLQCFFTDQTVGVCEV